MAAQKGLFCKLSSHPIDLISSAWATVALVTQTSISQYVTDYNAQLIPRLKSSTCNVSAICF